MKVPLFKICELSFFFAALSMAQAQQSIGTVGVQDATVAGALEVSNGRAILVGNTTVTAKRPHRGYCSEPGWLGEGVCDQRTAFDGGQGCGRRGTGSADAGARSRGD